MKHRCPDHISVFWYLLFYRDKLSPDTLYLEYFEMKLILQEFRQQFQALYYRVVQASGSLLLRALARDQIMDKMLQVKLMCAFTASMILRVSMSLKLDQHADERPGRLRESPYFSLPHDSRVIL